jgi:DNA polymerase III epsilon subunit-like protein
VLGNQRESLKLEELCKHSNVTDNRNNNANFSFHQADADVRACGALLEMLASKQPAHPLLDGYDKLHLYYSENFTLAGAQKVSSSKEQAAPKRQNKCSKCHLPKKTQCTCPKATRSTNLQYPQLH